MEYNKFLELLKANESETLDFKLECHAFSNKSEAAKAELAKDICAMSNNGAVASYIVVGVADDKRGFKTVDNSKLTDDNLQVFCKDVIFPPPKIKVHRPAWKKVKAQHKGKQFVIIQVGPNPSQPFCLARHFINWNEHFHHRRNEVWIRRGSTSDLASPQEIVRLSKGQPPIAKEGVANNVEYAQVPKQKRGEARREDLRGLLKDFDGKLLDDELLGVSFGKRRYVWKYFFVDKIAKMPIWWFTIPFEKYTHGVMLITESAVTIKPFKGAEAHFKEKWGWFGYFEDDIPFIILQKVTSSNQLKNALLQINRFVDDNGDVRNYLQKVRRKQKKELHVTLDKWTQRNPDIYKKVKRVEMYLSAVKPAK